MLGFRFFWYVGGELQPTYLQEGDMLVFSKTDYTYGFDRNHHDLCFEVGDSEHLDKKRFIGGSNKFLEILVFLEDMGIVATKKEDSETLLRYAISQSKGQGR